MNVFNRIVVILLILTLMVLIPLMLIFPEQVAFVLRYAADLLDLNLQWLGTLTSTAQMGVRFLLAAVALLVFLVGIVFLVLEVVRLRRGTVRLKEGSGELMMDSVSQHVAYFVDAIPDVIRVRPEVSSRGDKVRASVYAETIPEANVPAKTAEIAQTVQQVIEGQLGLQLDGQVRVVIRPVAYPKGYAKPAVPPAPAIAVQPAPAAALETFSPPLEVPPAVEEQALEVKRAATTGDAQ